MPPGIRFRRREAMLHSFIYNLRWRCTASPLHGRAAWAAGIGLREFLGLLRASYGLLYFVSI
jgi:hypothetical protein